MKKKFTAKTMDELQDNQEQSEDEAKAELIYWATGRTKIYPEKDFAKNYTDIKARSEKKRATKSNYVSTNVAPKEWLELQSEEDKQTWSVFNTPHNQLTAAPHVLTNFENG